MSNTSHLMGVCLGCGKGIPHGYLAFVTSSYSHDLSPLMKVWKPVDVWCRECARTARANGTLPKWKHVSAKKADKYEISDYVEPPVQPAKAIVVTLSAKEKALKLYSVLPKAASPIGFSARKTARKSGLPYDESIKPILKKLESIGKVMCVDKRWKRK